MSEDTQKSEIRFCGFFELERPEQLVKKLRYDLDRMRYDVPVDQYAALDFFMTAENITHWLYPGDGEDQERRKALVNSHHLLGITSHIANGAKHFRATRVWHDFVATAHRERYWGEGYVEESPRHTEGWIDQPLIISLTPKAAAAMGQPTIDVRDLARPVLKFWEDYFATQTSD